MISFASDYIAGAHPQVLERLIESNMESLSGYGSDPYCQRAINKIKEACQCPDGDVHFLVGGTQTNAVVIASMLQGFEGVVAAQTGHVSVHEAGALLAKGRLLGVQFDALFTDNLYFEISRHAIEMAEKLKDIFKEKGYQFYLESPTNQQFIILKNEQMEKLKEQVAFSFWEKLDEEHTVVRFATSWSTTEEDLMYLAEIC